MLLTRIKRRHKEYPEPSGSRLLAALYTRTKPYYAYDALGRPYSRDTDYSQKEEQHTAAFGYNSRSELTNAQLDEATYAYNYDNIGNRITAQEAAEEITYVANELNQYTQIDTNGNDFIPEYDANGNQTLVKTGTGIWHVTYNAQNRAVKFENTVDDTTIECAYDYMGRRFEKKVTTNGTVTLRQRYLYRGYLQIASYDVRQADPTAPTYIIWDPTQPTATRPLVIRKDNTWYTYGWDLTKNICEVYGPSGFIRTTYTYTPYGTVIAEGDVTQPIQWSSECHDTDLALIYYNYRYYNPTDGRWTRRDPIGFKGSINLYSYINNSPYTTNDQLGLFRSNVPIDGVYEEMGEKHVNCNECEENYKFYSSSTIELKINVGNSVIGGEVSTGLSQGREITGTVKPKYKVTFYYVFNCTSTKRVSSPIIAIIYAPAVIYAGGNEYYDVVCTPDGTKTVGEPANCS